MVDEGGEGDTSSVEYDEAGLGCGEADREVDPAECVFFVAWLGLCI